MLRRREKHNYPSVAEILGCDGRTDLYWRGRSPGDDPETLMQQISFVFQENFLFAGSVMNNIRLGQPPLERRSDCGGKSGACPDFIQSLPQGYETLVGEQGARLSGGQRQRIAIARAMLQDRPIIVLDEPTAFTDPQNEAALVRGLASLMQGKTVVLVAHRLSMVVSADQILVFSARPVG
ncbi:ABC transporter ATP-binding protein [Vibrio sp. PP-XX7]